MDESLTMSERYLQIRIRMRIASVLAMIASQALAGDFGVDVMH